MQCSVADAGAAAGAQAARLQAYMGAERHGAARRGSSGAQPSPAPGMARHGTAWVALARHITERRDQKRRGLVRHGAARTAWGGTA